MNVMIGLQLMLIGICTAMEPSCNGRQDKAQYYRALGENMELSLVKSISQILRFQLTKNNLVILRWRKNNTVFSFKESRFLFSPSDGTFRIDELKTGDSGEYRLEMFDASGKETGNRTLHLCVQAPVSSVQLVHQCLSPGQIKVSCLSEGDSPQYNWTLDGKTLTDSELLYGNDQTNIIVVRQNISGCLVCSVRNQVSSSSNYFNISDSGFKINCTSNRTQTDILVDRVNNTQNVDVTTVYPTIKHTTMAPVSSVQLVSECLSQGRMKVSCLSEKGDSPQYSWTLDGHTPTDSEIFSRNNVNNIIILRRTISGLLACLVRNQISQSFKQMSLFTCGVKPSCDGRKDGAQCFGALGSKVELTLVDSPSKIPGFQLKKNNSVILIWRNNNIIFSIEKSRLFFFPGNGTLRINFLNRTDSGQYKLDMFDKYGKETGFRTLQLFVQAPVISVKLVSECWFQGKMKVSCLSEGDSPQYSWTLDGHTLPDSELLSGNNENNIIILRENISGILACSVRNQISHSFKQINLSGCGVKMICDGRQDGAQCYEAFGSKVDIQLVENVSTIPRFHWTKNQSVILRWINNNILFRSKESKVLFFPNNGTVRIKDLSRTDSGHYKLEMFDKGGRQIGQRTLQFYVQAPVSSVQLVLKCLSQGQRKVSCLCEGDSPQYSWMLDGYPLTDSEIFSRNNESNIIILRENISGNLVCFVKNQISSSFNQINISGCGLSTLLVLGLRATVVILPVIGVSQYFTWRRKKIEKAKESAFSQITEDPESSVLMLEMKTFEQ